MFGENLFRFSELVFLRKLPKLEVFILLFWLSGPFLFLIERSPADFWIVVIDIAFLTRCVIKSDYTWISHWWVRSVFFFWLAMLLSAPVQPRYGATEAVFDQVSITCFCICVRLANYPALRAALIMTGIGLLLMMAILSAELITYEQWSATGGMSAV